MSYAYLPQQQYAMPGMMPEEEHSCPSSVPWIVGLVILFLIALGLGIWLLVLYLGGHVGCDPDRRITVTNPSITAGANDVTASWGTLSNETDRVTLYVSEKPFVLSSDGTVVNTTGIQQDSKTGSNNSIDITVRGNRSYNAMMVVTNTDTVNYLVFGPKRVFTQTNASLLITTGTDNERVIFNIRDLDSCNGAVSSSGDYTVTTGNVGLFRLGAPDDTSAGSQSFLVNNGVDPEAPDDTNEILCRIPTATQLTQTGMGHWVNKGTNDTPIVCLKDNTDNSTTDCTGDGNSRIDTANCQWSYNTEPTNPNMAGMNKWCLRSLQSETLNSTNKVPLCLVRNGAALNVANGQTSTDTWFNALTIDTNA